MDGWSEAERQQRAPLRLAALDARRLGGLSAIFGDRVAVALPPVTEDQTPVSVTVVARAIGPGEERLVVADLNRFPLTPRLVTAGGQVFVAFRTEIERATPVRAVACRGGLRHVGARYLDAPGGGCSVPPVAEKTVDGRNLGRLHGRVWRGEDDLHLPPDIVTVRFPAPRTRRSRSAVPAAVGGSIQGSGSRASVRSRSAWMLR